MNLAQLIDAIPVVQSTADRGARFQTPTTDQRVYNKGTKYIERWDGAVWQPELFAGGSPAASLGWFNVKDPAYGAKVDGVSDDLAAVNTLLAAIPAGGGEMYVPAGTMGVSAQISPPGGKRIRILGGGRDTTIIKHLTGGRVINWVQGHLVAEYGSGMEDLTIMGTGGVPSEIVLLQDMSLPHFAKLALRNNNVIIAATGLRIMSLFDFEINDWYVTDCGGGAAQCVVIDSTVTASDNTNNGNIINLHIEPGDVDCDYLSIIGNATNPVVDLKFYGLKTHGNQVSGNPGAGHCLVRLSQYVQGCDFFSHLFAFGKGTAQIINDGQHNSWFGGTVGITGAHPPTYAIQNTANGSMNTYDRLLFKTPASYTAVMRVEVGSVHNKLLWPKGNFTGATLLSDAQGRSTAIWDDNGTNIGIIFQAGEGLQWKGVNPLEQRVDLGWGASVAVQNYLSRKFWLTATSNIAAVLATPTSPAAVGQSQHVSITVRNNTGGALTTGVTGSAKWKLSAAIQPANGTQITVDADYDQVQDLWIETSRSAAV